MSCSFRIFGRWWNMIETWFFFPETSVFSLFGLKVFLASQNSAADVISIQRVQRENRNYCDAKCKTRIRKSRQVEEMEKRRRDDGHVIGSWLYKWPSSERNLMDRTKRHKCREIWTKLGHRTIYDNYESKWNSFLYTVDHIDRIESVLK